MNGQPVDSSLPTEGENDESRDSKSGEKDLRKSVFVSQVQDHDEMSGYLHKRRGGFGRHMPNAWQLRYFTLRDGIMYYFEDSGGVAKPRGKIDLKTENCTFFNGVTMEGAPSLYTMQIVPGGWEEKWKLCAQSKEDMELWVAAIMRHITDERKRKPAPLNLKEYESSDDEDEKREAVPEVSPDFTNVRPPPQPINATYASGNKSNTEISSTKGKGKRKLKLQTDTSGESDEMEFVMVLVIVNLCVVFAYSSHLLWGVLYLVVANLVVARTLQLRSLRLQQTTAALQAAAKSAMTAAAAKDQETIGRGKAPEEETGGNQASAASGTSPEPGSTMRQVIGGVPPDVPTHTWCVCDHSTFNVRVGPDYSRNKKKGPSGPPIYEPFAVDTFCAKSRIDHVAQHISLANIEKIDTHNEYVPPVLIVQIQMPSDSPPLFETIEDGPGWAIVMYFKITQRACEELKDLASASPAIKLFAKYCQYAETDPAWRGRFKVINYCSNLEEMGVPNVIMSYNAKPVLIRRTGSIFRGENKDSKYLEIDIHVHKFANLAKKSIHALSSRCSLMYMQIGFVVEGREDPELPETLFACVGVNRPEEDQAEFLFDLPDEID